jgi:hypothetical protein
MAAVRVRALTSSCTITQSRVTSSERQVTAVSHRTDPRQRTEPEGMEHTYSAAVWRDEGGMETVPKRGRGLEARVTM